MSEDKRYNWKLRKSIGGIEFGDSLSEVRNKFDLQFENEISDDSDGVTCSYRVLGEGLSIMVTGGRVESVSCDANCYVGVCNVIGEKFDSVRLLFGIDDFYLDDEFELHVPEQVYYSEYASAMVWCENNIVVSLSVSND